MKDITHTTQICETNIMDYSMAKTVSDKKITRRSAMAMLASGAALAPLGMGLKGAFAQTPEAVNMVIQQATYKLSLIHI